MNTVFVEAKLFLEDSVHFSQFIIGDVLVTLIGNLHGHKVRCPSAYPALSVDEYCGRVVQHNPDRVKVYLEFHRDVDPFMIDDPLAHKVIEKLSKIEKTSVIVPFDVRADYFSRVDQDIIHWSDKFYDLSPGDIEKIYIDPVEKKFLRKPKIHVRELQSFYKRIIAFYHKTRIDFAVDPYESRFSITRLWRMIMDYQLLYDILSLNPTSNNHNINYNECVVVVGDSHRESIESILEEMEKNNTAYSAASSSVYVRKIVSNAAGDTCVSLFRTMYIDGLASPSAPQQTSATTQNDR